MKQAVFLLTGVVFLLIISCKPTAEPTPPVYQTGVDSNSWVTIPAGNFYKGQHEYVTEVPYDYEIMVTNVTNKQYADFLNIIINNENFVFEDGVPFMRYPGDEFHGHGHEKEISKGWYSMIAIGEPGIRIIFDGGSYTSVQGFANHPVTFVTWFGAVAYADYYGWRLPTEVEWEKAARGTDTRPFPWGDTLYKGNANYYISRDPFEDSFGKYGTTTPVGFYNGRTYENFVTIDSTSPYGLYDMAGNVWQWTGDVYEKQHYRYMRGGSKATYSHNLRVWVRNSAGPEYYSLAVGFRCARDK